ncbi:MAG TPA: hypothetical protein VH518_24220 [Tepidisphaeraceae bacterium]|jgi:hypothetical protein
MRRACTILSGVGLMLGVIGCHEDKPHEYGQERPPVERLDPRDSGLQSKDVVAASDKMAMSLLALPELNASQHRWLIVVDRADNLTADNRQNLDIFLQRVGVKLWQQGRGRVQLIENRDKLRELQSRELEGTASADEYGQGGHAAPGPAGIQPDFSLYARIMEMPNRGTSYFLCEFTLTDLHNRTKVWMDSYEVKVNN